MEPNLRYPIGKFERPTNTTEQQRGYFIGEIAETPWHLARAAAGLDRQQLDTAYRLDGWTVRQLIHHLPDSHMNAYIRFKLALTEDEPTIKPYDEALWAELPDSKNTPIEVSLVLLENLHCLWLALLWSLAPADWARKFRHPELGTMTLDELLALYAWHGRHHIAHITSLRERNGWKYPRMILRYRSGEEIMKGDRVLFHGNPAEIELAATDPESADTDTRWHADEFGGGVMVLDPKISGRTFIPVAQIYGCEDLEFVRRAEVS